MKHSELKQLIKEEISKVLELRTIDYKPKDDLVHLYLMTYSDKVGEPYFERKYKKFRSDVESLLQSFDAAIEDDHGVSDKNLKILVNRKDKTKIKNILSKLSNRYGFESELEIDTLEETRSALNEGEFYPSTRIGSITNQKDIDEFDKDLFVQKMYEQGRIRVDELDISYDDEWQIFIDKKDKVVIKFLKNNYPQHLQIDSYLAKQLAG
jgi:hypothetical protein